ncbi:MAG TPA: hypothetical protein ENF77_00345 [Candidatus Acetothermia bacterium]|nr:hypothetical protein [Candidatus Acetothermia bacterium]
MSDVMRPQPFEVLLRWILVELEARREIFGIPEELFFRPSPGDPFAVEDFLGSRLDTPIGPAAGPHTQMAQNIVAAWLSGGRFIELKTVQILDEIEVPRPCIDMEDEGYNVEWSQELRLEQSAWEYIKAWALIHILRRSLGFEDRPFGTIFNMSVGYDLKGITSPRMVRFMDRLQDASAELTEIKGVLKERFPRFADIEIPPRIVNSVTLSTMHGCPPDEIEQIAAYLLQERKLHTFVKLNPTLLGKEEVERILHDDLGFTEIEVPEEAFAHDLQYEEALGIIRRLQAVAREEGLVFGVKLSNTLPVRNPQRTASWGGDVHVRPCPLSHHHEPLLEAGPGSGWRPHRLLRRGRGRGERGGDPFVRRPPGDHGLGPPETGGIFPHAPVLGEHPEGDGAPGSPEPR